MTEQTATVSRTVSLPANPREVWAVIGGFQDLAAWHPVVRACRHEAAGDREYRHLVTEDGAELTEELLSSGPHSYHYRINKPGPLPVAHYEATLSADSGADGGAVVTWSSSFVPTAEGAESAVAGIYEAGLDALAKKFG